MLLGEKVAFIGHSKHTLDAKGRLSLPSDYRFGLGERCFLLPIEEDRVVVYPEFAYIKLYEKVEQVSEQFNGMAMADPAFLAMVDLVISKAERTNVDDHGRIQVPLRIREHMGQNKDVHVVGRGSTFEIWRDELWQAHEQAKSISFLDALRALNEAAQKRTEPSGESEPSEDHHG